MTATERGRVLVTIGEMVLGHEEELAQIEARDTGKPMTTARNDIKVRGRTVAPALAMGNATVLKPAEDTSLSALRIAELATAAGLPEGALHIVTGLGEEAGAALAGHLGIDFISFTGSNEVGTLVQQAAARNAVKCVLELGGKSPRNQARAAGIAVLAEGSIAADAPRTGCCVRPTLFGPVPRDAALAREEVFGPVLAAMPFDDEADAIRRANGTDYGLLAAVWTESAGRLQRVAKAVKAGQVFMNGYGAGGGVELPFGGTKRSGHGREKGLLALEEMSTTKTLVHFHGWERGRQKYSPAPAQRGAGFLPPTLLGCRQPRPRQLRPPPCP